MFQYSICMTIVLMVISVLGLGFGVIPVQHPAPTISQNGLDSLQHAVVVFCLIFNLCSNIHIHTWWSSTATYTGGVNVCTHSIQTD